MGQLRTFMEAIKTRGVAVVDGSAVKVFPRTMIVPFLDVERLMKNPRWPAALITDNGGTLNERNGKIWTRNFSVSVVDSHPRDNVGELTVKELWDMGDFLLTAMEYDTDLTIWNAGDDDLEAVGTDAGVLVLVKTYRFTAELQRT